MSSVVLYLAFRRTRRFAIECAEFVPGEINGPPKEAESEEEAKQAAALDADRLETIKGFGGASQSVRDCPSTEPLGARRPLEGSHRGNIARDEMTPVR